jgi:DNA invertase Pin-like site-specific DNA recombinase
MKAATAFSYIRFSSPEQAKGDSLRRQTEATADWCKRHGATLDTSTTFRDLGRSAYHGAHRQNPDRNALAGFLKMVEDGRVPRGSYLVIENLDRLSREQIQPALLLVLNLLQAGVRIVQLKPAEMVFDERSDTLPVMMMMVELSRGHSESAVKSDRLSAAWKERRRRVREEGAIMTRRLPAWVDEQDGKLIPNPARAAIVKRMFDLAVNGYGLSLIVKTLSVEKVKTWGRGGTWSKAYVYKIISGRAVLGEYQPIKAGKPDGPVLANYYPAVIGEDVWNRAQAALANRKDKQGRVGVKVASLFSGLLWDAMTQTRMLIAGQTRGPKGKRQKARVITSAASMEGCAPSVSFPYPVFEAAILSLLREVRVADVIGEEPEGESIALAGALAGVEQRLRAIEADLTGDGDVPALVRAAKALDEKRQALVRQLSEARQREANPRGVAWAETKSLLDVAKDEPSRLRLRALLRSIVEDIHVVVVPRRSHRLCAVQMRFAGGACRDYLIHYRAAGYCREGGWDARSLADVAKPGDLDLRKPAHARALEKMLKEELIG